MLYGIRLRLFLANECSQLGLEQARHITMAAPGGGDADRRSGRRREGVSGKWQYDFLYFSLILAGC